MATTPLTASRYPVSSDSANIAQYFQNLAIDLDDNAVPRFTTTTARDTAYSSWVTAGGVMADGLVCMVNGVPYRRINGTWRVNRNRNIERTVTPTGGAQTITAGGAAETGVTTGATGLASFTLYEAGTIRFTATFRAGSNTTAALCSVKINSSVVGNVSVSRSNPDGPAVCVGTLALAQGTHTVALRVDTSGGGGANWVDGRITIGEGIAE